MPIKQYKNVNGLDEHVNFRISRMEDIYDERDGETDTPHRHSYYTVLFTLDADGTHVIDFNSYPLQSEEVYFISPGQVHQVIEKRRSKGYGILFSPDFLVENNIPVSFIDDLHLFSGCGENPPLKLNTSEIRELQRISEEIVRLYHSNDKFKELAIGSYLKLFLIQCNNLCSLSPGNSRQTEAGNIILKKFKTMVEEQHQYKHSISDYARALHITPDHLNKVVKSLIGKSAKEYVQERIILSAKRMLYFTEFPAKHIGYELGFSEPANFSAFFKKGTGVSPSSFRENQA